MDFEPGVPEAPEVQMIPVFSWGPMMMPQPDLDWPIGDVDDQILDPEPEIIDLDSDDETIKGLKDKIIVSDDSDYTLCIIRKYVTKFCIIRHEQVVCKVFCQILLYIRQKRPPYFV